MALCLRISLALEKVNWYLPKREKRRKFVFFYQNTTLFHKLFSWRVQCLVSIKVYFWNYEFSDKMHMVIVYAPPPPNQKGRQSSEIHRNNEQDYTRCFWKIGDYLENGSTETQNEKETQYFM
jgi:hypothetical protein